MSIRSIMTTKLVSVKPDDTVANTLLLMRDHHLHNIPVLDDKNNFVGLFSLRRINHALLPKAAQIDDSRWQINLNFMPDDSDKMLCKLLEIGQQPVSQFLEEESKLRFCGPDASISELLHLLYENSISLPVLVIKGEERKLEGMVSNWDVLTGLAVNMIGSRSLKLNEIDKPDCPTETGDD